MKLKIFPKLSKSIVLAFFLISSVQVFAQTTYKVVCDKTDNTVKVVKSDNRSANLVPIKGGLPSMQVANDWINKNYNSTKCDPGQIINDIRKNKTTPELQPTAPAAITKTKAQTLAPAVKTATKVQTVPPKAKGATNTSKARASSYTPTASAQQKFKNNSLLLNARVTNLGDIFGYDEKIKGYGIGLEKLFGDQVYFGTGLNVDMYSFDENNKYNDKDALLFFFKIPVFAGYRTTINKLTIMGEAGGTGAIIVPGSDFSSESFNTAFEDPYFNFMTRIKAGTQKIMFEIGAEFWITEIIEDDSFKMNSFYFGIRLNF